MKSNVFGNAAAASQNNIIVCIIIVCVIASIIGFVPVDIGASSEPSLRGKAVGPLLCGVSRRSGIPPTGA